MNLLSRIHLLKGEKEEQWTKWMEKRRERMKDERDRADRQVFTQQRRRIEDTRIVAM